MPALKQPSMTADEFIAWSIDRPDGGRYELMDGEVFEMASERYRHALVKGAVYFQFRQTVAAAGLQCDVFSDGMAVRINDGTVYEPDAAVRIGPRLDMDATHYDDPVIVVEVLSPSTRSLDAGLKLAEYFSLSSLRHYVLVRTNPPMVVHHFRLDDGTIQTRPMTAGRLELTPPGISLDVGLMFS